MGKINQFGKTRDAQIAKINFPLPRVEYRNLKHSHPK